MILGLSISFFSIMRKFLINEILVYVYYTQNLLFDGRIRFCLKVESTLY